MKGKQNSGSEITPLDRKTTDESSNSIEATSQTRRDFIRKYGALAAVTPVAMTLTMHSKKALASSCTECGP